MHKPKEKQENSVSSVFSPRPADALMDKARALAAQAWCDSETSGIEMDPRLTEAFARRLADLLADLDSATDIIAWMSGSNDFSPGGVAAEGWRRARKELNRLMAVVLDPAGKGIGQ